ncbi:MAG: hypothetical protein AB8B65_00385 [Kordia sp.]|uniref:hypothetical protein n=1 Tax=Kordia sp. TaxID=1965332 RepID=UPI00385E4393
MTNIFSNINFREGKLSNTNAVLLLDVPLEDQKYNLFEDILQITYTSKNLKYVIDIGWYFEDFEISEDSFFWVQIILNEDWSNLIFDKKTNNINELKNLIEEGVEIICEFV